MNLHREGVIPLHEKTGRDGREHNLEITVICHTLLGKIVVGWIGTYIVDPDLRSIEKYHDPVIAKNPAGGAHDCIHALDREGAAKVGGGVHVIAIPTKTNLGILVTVTIPQFCRTTIPLRVVVAGFPPLPAKIRARIVEPPFDSIRHHRFHAPPRTPRYTHFKGFVFQGHITVILDDRRIRTRIHSQSYHRQPGLQRSIAGAVTEAVCAEEVIIRRITEGSIRIQSERSVLHVLSLDRAQTLIFRITIVIEHPLARKVHG